jgi:hypothetical protein
MTVTFKWNDAPDWIKKAIGSSVYTDSTGSLWQDPAANLWCRIRKGFFFDVSVIGGNEKTLPAALPHDWMYAHVKDLAAQFGVSRRTMLHIADHWFLATLRMSGWIFPRTYFIAVRSLGYAFNSLFSASK